MLDGSNSVPDDIAVYLSCIKPPHDAVNRGRPCTLVEFSTPEEAEACCAALNDDKDWRNGTWSQGLLNMMSTGILEMHNIYFKFLYLY